MTTSIKTPANLDALISSGDVVRNTEKNLVTITTKTGKVEVEYVRNEATTLEGALGLVGGDMAEVLKRFNYGHDLKVRAQVRAQEEAKHVDPAKKDDKAIANLVATGLYTEEEARGMLEAKRAAAGA